MNWLIQKFVKTSTLSMFGKAECASDFAISMRLLFLELSFNLLITRKPFNCQNFWDFHALELTPRFRLSQHTLFLLRSDPGFTHKISSNPFLFPVSGFQHWKQEASPNLKMEKTRVGKWFRYLYSDFLQFLSIAARERMRQRSGPFQVEDPIVLVSSRSDSFPTRNIFDVAPFQPEDVRS